MTAWRINKIFKKRAYLSLAACRWFFNDTPALPWPALPLAYLLVLEQVICREMSLRCFN